MISKFMTEATEAANAKAFCDEENAKAQKSQVEKTSFFDEFIARVEEAASKSGILTDAVAEFQKELAEMDKAQADASEAANAKAFCVEENAKTRKSQTEKTALYNKFTTHADEPFYTLGKATLQPTQDAKG